MSKPAEELASKIEQNVLRKVYVLLAGALVFALFGGIGIGLLLGEPRATANEPLNSRAAEAISSSFSEVATQVEPAVVNIDTKGKVPEVSPTLDFGNEKPKVTTPDDILEYFRRQQRRPSMSVGSGFIVDKQGYILTNFHVVDDAARITVSLQNGEEFVARIIGTDVDTDLAVLKIDAGRDLPSVRLGDSNSAQVGDWVLAIGSPFGLAQTVTAGIISQTKRETPSASAFQKFIQTDAAINRGNSGGPLVNMRGEVIGVNSQIATSTGDYNGIGFALPSNEAAFVYQQILQNGSVRRGFLGVNLDSVKSEFAKIYGLTEAKGAIVTSVSERDSPAGRAGLQSNDVIVEFGGKTVESAQDLIEKVAATEPEKEMNVVYLRETGNSLERRTTVIRLGSRPRSNRAAFSEEADKKPEPKNPATVVPLGLTVVEMTPQAAAGRFEGLKGLVVKSIDPSSFLADLKNSNGGDALNEGDLIQRVNRVNVTDLKSFNETISKLKPGDAVVMHIATSNRSRNVQQRIVQFTVQ